MAVPAVKGVEFGAGFRAAELRGSENNDAFLLKNGKVVASTEFAGGVLGGLSWYADCDACGDKEALRPILKNRKQC